MSALMRERASRGAIFLDRRMPDWFKKINLERLDLAFSNACVIGQLGQGDYDFNDWREQAGKNFAIKLGFYIRHTNLKNWKKQTDAWREEIQLRLRQAA